MVKGNLGADATVGHSLGALLLINPLLALLEPVFLLESRVYLALVLRALSLFVLALLLGSLLELLLLGLE